MSYIHDALRKSEVDRQRAAEQEKINDGIRAPQPAKYAASKRLPLVIGTAFLLTVSITIFIFIQAENTPLSKNSSEQAVMPAKENKKIISTVHEIQKKNTIQASSKPKTFNELPFFWEKPVAYRQGIDPFSVSIHVYAPEPSKRILFINNREYRAGEQTQQGPRIESIEPQGVILSYRGEYFKLPRPR